MVLRPSHREDAMLSDTIQVTVNGIALGLLYALVLFGILLIFRVSKVVNFAHGQFAMFGGLGSLYLILGFGWPLWLAIVVIVPAVAVVAILTDVLLVRRLPSPPDGRDLVLTLGLLLAFTSFGENILQQGAPRRYPDLSTESFVVAGGFIEGDRLIALGVALAIFAISLVFLLRTRIGLIVRAAAEDPVVAEGLGYNVRLIRTATWGVAGALAAVAGIFIAARIPVDAFYTEDALVKAFVAGIIGGLHRFTAPILAAIGLGLFENWFSYFTGAVFRVPGVFGLVVLILAFAPKRFLEVRGEARA